MSIYQITPFLFGIPKDGPQPTHYFMYDHHFLRTEFQEYVDGDDMPCTVGYLKGWTWHMNEMFKPNIRPHFTVPDALNQGPVIAPAVKSTHQPSIINGTFGFVFKLTPELKAMLTKKCDGKVPMALNINSFVQTPNGSRTIATKALVYWDPINTRDTLNNNIMDGYLGIDEQQNWKVGLTVLLRRGVPAVWLDRIMRRLAGQVVDPEPIFWSETGIPHDPLWQREVQRIRIDQQGQQQLGQQREACRQMPLTPPTSSPRSMTSIVQPKPAIREVIERPQTVLNNRPKSAVRPLMKAAPDRQQIEAIRARQEQNRISGIERTQPSQRIQGQIAHNNSATVNEASQAPINQAHSNITHNAPLIQNKAAQAQPNHGQGHIIHNTPVIPKTAPPAQINHTQGQIIHNTPMIPNNTLSTQTNQAQGQIIKHTPSIQNKNTQAQTNQVQGQILHSNPAIRSEGPQARPDQARQLTPAQTEANRLIREEAHSPQNSQRFIEFVARLEGEYRRNLQSDPENAEQIRAHKWQNVCRQLHHAAIARINAQQNAQQMAPQANKRKMDGMDRLEDSKRAKTATDAQ